MAIIRPSQYPGRWNPVSADAPQGSGKNRTAPGSNDGSYFDQVWFDDADSLNQALFISSGVSPNGVQDIGTASQLFDALINNRWSNIGNYFPGTIVTGSNGNQYYCKLANGRDSTVIDPVTAPDRNTWVQYPESIEVSGSTTTIKTYDDRLVVFGKTSSNLPTGSTINFPAGAVFSSQPNMIVSLDGSAGIATTVASAEVGTTSFDITITNPGGTYFVFWRAEGYL